MKNKALLIISSSFILAFGVGVFRSATFNSSLHTAFATLALALLISYFFKTAKLQSLIASIICMISLFLAEFLVFAVYKYLFSIDINKIVHINYNWVISNWLHIILLALLAFLLKKSNRYQQNTFFGTQA